MMDFRIVDFSLFVSWGFPMLDISTFEFDHLWHAFPLAIFSFSKWGLCSLSFVAKRFQLSSFLFFESERFPLIPPGYEARAASSQIKIFIFDIEGEQPHQYLFFSIPFSPPGCYTTRRRAAPGGLPSCWIAAWWRKGDVKAENVSVALQTEKYMFSFSKIHIQ